jgi:uncharacterized cupredoxin-like copper-binding protein
MVTGNVRSLLALATMALLAACLAHGAFAAKTTKVTVTAGKPTEFAFKLSKKTVPVGKVTFKITNKGALSHTFKVCASPKGGKADSCTGKSTKVLSPNKTVTLTYVFKKKGTYEYLCTIAGHAAAGMKGDLKVTG